MYDFDDSSLVKNIQNDQFVEVSLQQLIERHSGIYVKTVTGMLSDPSLNTVRCDLLDDKDRVIYESAKKYDISKNTKFSTYLGNTAKWLCLNSISKNPKGQFISIDETSFKEILDPNMEIPIYDEQKIIEETFSIVREIGDEEDFVIFSMRYGGEGNKKKTWREISAKIGITPQGTIYKHDRMLKKVKKRLLSKHEVDS